MVNVIKSDTEAIAIATELGRKFAVDDAARDAQRILPYDLVDELSQSGLLAITVPKGHGGAGVTARTLGEVFTELSAGDASLGQLPQNHFFFLNVLAQAGSAEQRRFFYAEVLRGQRFGNALAERGSRDARDFRIGFTPQPDGGYLLDGAKYYCTGSVYAHWIPVYAKDPDGRLHAAWVRPGDLGIAVAALRDGKHLIRTTARPWWEAGVDRAADEPSVIEKFGELALLVRAARALVRAAGDALDAANPELPGGKLTEQTSAEASVAVAAARAQADTAAVTVSSDVFALIGSRAAQAELNLHRHWRNARTHTLHDPRRWKVRHVGEWELNDVSPPRNGIV